MLSFKYNNNYLRRLRHKDVVFRTFKLTKRETVKVEMEFPCTLSEMYPIQNRLAATYLRWSRF